MLDNRVMGPLEIELQQRLQLIVRGTPWLFRVLEIVRALGLPDWYLAAGAIRNTVWDALHGTTSLRPESDLDVIYFGSVELSHDAERLLRNMAPEYSWEVTNQASVHHWQSHAAGRDIPAYSSISAAVASWPETATAVGVRLSDRDLLEVMAPHGLADLFALTVRPSPDASDPHAYSSRLRQKQWHLRWPRLLVVPGEP